MKNSLIKSLSSIASVAVVAAMLTAAQVSSAQAVAVGAAIPAGIVTHDLNAVGTTATSLAQELAGAGVTVSNVSYQGANAQLGTIDIVDPNVVSFNHGVIMSSGNIADVAGPNKSESTTTSLLYGGTFAGNNPGASDADLTSLIANTQTVNPMTYDATSLSFDFVPNSNKIYFTYVFGSDEYLEWVNLFNDVFAFYVNGTNCATVPDGNGGSLPVSIDSVNSNVNPTLYRDNSFMSPPANPLNIETDGLTVEMVCQASVNPGVVNHMKLAIADTSDSILDSTVVIKAGSLSTTKPELCFNGLDDDANNQVDMNDTKCQATITPAPAGQSGVGNTTPPAGVTPPPAADPATQTGTPIPAGQPVVPYNGAPAFTGNEGTPVLLDISTQGWKMSADTLKTYWTVTGINGTTGSCTVYGGADVASAASMIGSNPAPAYAVCPNEGEYVAHIWGLDIESKSSDDKDLDFFVHNAAPQTSVLYPTIDSGSSYAVGDPVDVAISAVDPGVNDTLTCQLNWGDGTNEAGTYDSASAACYGTHYYAKPGSMLISATVTDNAKASSAVATLVTVDSGSLTTQTITLNTALPATATYGSSFAIDASSDSGYALSYSTSGSCTNVGATVTMTAGSGDCTIALDQAGDQYYSAAATVSATVSATQRPITVTAAAKSKVAGTADPALTQSITSGSLINGDALSGSLARSAGETPGTYAINQGTLTAGSNYALTFVGANLTITGTAPTVTTQPTAQTAAAGSPVTFSAAASGNPAPSIQWQVAAAGTASYANIGGATSGSYSFTPTTADNGKLFRAQFTNGVGGAANSTGVALSVFGITSFTPAAAAVGATVTLTGTNLTGTTAVKFNGLAATSFVVVSATSITAVVPTGVTTGPISLVKGLLTPASATNFSLAVAPAVTLAPVSQTVTVGSTVTLTAAASGAPTPTVAWQSSTNGTTWTAIAGATSTTYSFVAASTDNNKQFRAVFSNGVGTAANSAAAVITILGVTSFTPAAGPVGTVVTLTGTNFTGATAVKFNGVSATAFTVVSATSISATVPTGATSGLITVIKGSATAPSATSYAVGIPPKVTTTAPTSGGVGTAVTLTGTGFSAVTSVKFTGTTVSAPFKIVSDTTILTVVPSGATAGVITLTNSVASATTASFSATATLVVPTVTAYSVGSVRAGNAVTLTLTGTNLAGATGVALNGTSLNFSALTATTLSVTVPASGVASGPIKVTTAGGTSVNTIVFNVLVAATSLSAGASHSCAVLADGTAKCWGLNTNGQLGNGTTTQATSPVAVTGLSGVSSVSAGGAFSCAVIGAGANGTVKCWGLNTNGQLGNGTTTQSTTAVAVTGITNAVSVSAGTSHACAVLFDGTAKCWGLNTNGQLGNGTTTQATTAVAVTGLSGATAISAGANSTCAALSSGAVKCWGLNTNGQLGNGTTTQATTAVAVTGIDGTAAKATSVAVGTSYACARISDGTLRCWGLNTSGQLGDGTVVQKTTAVVVKLNATTNVTGATQITAGATHACAMIGTGTTATAICWGANGNGRLGNAGTTNSSFAVAVVATLTTGISAIAAGGSHTIALAPSTSLPPVAGVAWGVNTNGQLGTGATTAVTTPTALTTL